MTILELDAALGLLHPSVEHRSVRFDVAAVVDALHRRRHPNRDFIASVLTRGAFVEAD